MFQYIIFLMFILTCTHSFNISNINDFSRLQIAKVSKMMYTSTAFLKTKYAYEETDSPDEDIQLKNIENDIRISHIENAIYFYSPLNEESAFDLEKKLIALNNYNIKEGNPGPIHLHIQSFGGSLFHTLYIIDLIQNLETPIYTYVDGFAASAGTLMSVVGKKRFMTKHSLMLVHQLSGGVQGKYSEIKDESENVEVLMNLILDIYLEKTKLDKKSLIDLLHHDLWLNSEKCLSYGFVDEVI